jgi:dTMP kinase
MSKGYFIVFEGIDGCGKGTQIKAIHNWLWDLNKNIDLLTTREPTRDFSQIRERMASGKNTQDDRVWYAQQFTADRIHHCKTIEENLKKGTHVLCDRYYHSTLAYQNTQGIPFLDLLKMQRQEGILIPDLTIIYDCPARTAFERRRKDGATDIFDKDLDFQERLRQNYLLLPEKLPQEKIIIIDAKKSPEEIFEQTKKEIVSNLGINSSQ